MNKSRHMYFQFLKQYTLKKRMIFKYVMIVAVIICTLYVSIIQPEYQRSIVDQLTKISDGDLSKLITKIYF